MGACPGCGVAEGWSSAVAGRGLVAGTNREPASPPMTDGMMAPRGPMAKSADAGLLWKILSFREAGAHARGISGTQDPAGTVVSIEFRLL